MLKSASIRVLGRMATTKQVNKYVHTASLTGISYEYKGAVHLQKAPQPVVSGIICDNNERLFHVKWSSGDVSKFPYVWLRDNSPEEHTYNRTTNNRARKLLMAQLDIKVFPTATRVEEEGVVIEWSDGSGESKYTWDWLLRRDLWSSNKNILHTRREYHFADISLWGEKEITPILEQKADFERMLVDDLYFVHQMSNFLKYGALIAENVPTETGQVERFCKKCGFMDNTHYGYVFSVTSNVQASNLAYTDAGLGFHNDLSCLSHLPEVQMLHCISQAKEGGENQLVDGFQVAKQLREELPHIFRLLSTVPIEYIDWGKDNNFRYHMARRNCVINPEGFRLDQNDEVKGIFFTNPLRSWYIDVPVKEVSSVYEALKTFNNYCYQSRNLFQTKLNPGEAMLFANDRVLHGRSAFTSTGEGGERHLEGAYMNYDYVRSTIRVIMEKHNPNNYHTTF